MCFISFLIDCLWLPSEVGTGEQISLILMNLRRWRAVRTPTRPFPTESNLGSDLSFPNPCSILFCCIPKCAPVPITCTLPCIYNMCVLLLSENYTCPGHYKCLGSPVCILPHQRCDGTRQCPDGDDEWHCDVICPGGCNCTGLTFLCTNGGLFFPPADISIWARKLDLHRNNISELNGTFDKLTSLGELILVENSISAISRGAFSTLVNLYLLDLSYNKIQHLDNGAFIGLSNLLYLNLRGNTGVAKIHHYTFSGLSKLPSLKLRGMSISLIDPNAFTHLKALESLDLSQNVLRSVEGTFSGLSGLRHLNISINRGLQVSRVDLRKLVGLQFLQSDDYKYCCFMKDFVDGDRCLPEPDEFSSCEDLMSRDVLKGFLWVLGLMAFLCNLFVLIWRRMERLTVYSFSVMNLAVADFLMGVYMVSLACVDAYYRGVYIEYAQMWTGSWLCQALGFLNTLSSEASVLTLCVISADRFYKIVYPLQGAKFNLSVAKRCMGVVWLVAFVLAALPVFPLDYFNGRYYGRSSVCISIYLTNEWTPGWEFSVFVFHGLNFFSFLFIFVAYIYIYYTVTSSRMETKNLKSGAAQSDVVLARKLVLVVATDFLCWVPINIMGRCWILLTDDTGHISSSNIICI